MSLNRNTALGASVIAGLFFCGIFLNKLAAPIICIIGLFVFLPLFWLGVASRITEDFWNRVIIMVAAFLAVIAFSLFF